MFSAINELNFQEKKVGNFSVYTMENFYKYPHDIKELFLKSIKPGLLGSDEKNHHNGNYFLEQRHWLLHSGYNKLQNKLYQHFNCTHRPISGEKTEAVMTNVFEFRESKWNDYKNCWYWPHIDIPEHEEDPFNCRWVALVYLNEKECDGTNLYSPPKLGWSPFEFQQQRETVWVEKKYFDLLYHCKSKFNRIVIFPCDVFHGAAINNDTFCIPTEEPRINMPIFF